MSKRTGPVLPGSNVKRQSKSEKITKDAKAAREAGMTYGQYMARDYLPKPKKAEAEELEPPKETKAKAAPAKSKTGKKIDEQMRMLWRAKCIIEACEENGIGTTVTWISKGNKPHTPAGKIMKEILSGKEEFPTKFSFMYCDELDMHFFFDNDGRARISYSGTTSAGTKDITGGLAKAFETAGKVLNRMQELYDAGDQTEKGVING